jgi:hypothetical protein
MKIIGMEGLSNDVALNYELQRGGKFVVYSYCISVLIMTFKRSSDVYFIKSTESRMSKGLVFSLISLLAGWWGFPWGPIYTVGSIITNFSGGKDITNEVILSMSGAAEATGANAKS